MPNLVPYSNFHELNLDWILQEIKQLRADVDAFIGSAVPSNETPLMDGVAAVGTSVNYSRGDHVHPTDTSRASVTYVDDRCDSIGSDLSDALIDLRQLERNVAFSTAAPQMDGVASPGSSDEYIRADHVHPTDTSRASQTQVDSLQAQMDAFAGAANPSQVTPLMDGVGSAGSTNNYSRGDHVHPSDSSKLDVAGGTITGDLTVQGDFQAEKVERLLTGIDSIGWRRIIEDADEMGTRIRITLSRQSTGHPAESHTVLFTNDDIDGPVFSEESSDGSVCYLDKIRYTSEGVIDLHVDQLYPSNIKIGLEVCSAGATAAYIPDIVIDVDDAPAGETIIEEYSLHADGIYLPDINAASINNMSIEMGQANANQTKSFTMDNNTYALFVISSTRAEIRSIVIAYTAAGGAVGYTVLPDAASLTRLTIQTATNTISFTPTGYTLYALKLGFHM